MSTQEEPRENNFNGSTYQGVSQLLNSIARDLDHMLYELGQSPPLSPINDDFSSGSHYRRAAFRQSNQNNSRNSSGDALLEQFVQSLIDSLTVPGTPDGRSSVLSSASLCTLGLSGGGQGTDNSSQTSESVEGAAVAAEDDYVDQACDISILERIIRTHPVWFLPSITRPGAIHLLQGKEIGNFVVRKSSKPNTMAISVRLPNNKGPYIEHYLIEATGREYHLEGSDNHFEAIPTLVTHYCQCCDELPVQLTLPQTISVASSRQELSSIAMLGQDFWVSTMAKSSSSTYLLESLAKEPTSQATQNCPATTTTTVSSFSTFGQQTTTASTSKPAIISLDSNKIYDSNSSLFQSSRSSKTSTLEHKPASLSPPPPPPRWCKPQTVFTTASNFTVTTTVTINMNQCKTSVPANTIPTDNNTDILPIDNDNSEPLKRPQTLTGSRKSKSGKHKKKTNHYTQSNIIDSPPDYYRSSLADKISDYEDIWASPSKPDTPQPVDSKYEFVTFKAQGSPTAKEKTAEMLASSNQTDQEKVKAKAKEHLGNDVIPESDEKSNGVVHDSPKKVRNKLGLTILTGKFASHESRNSPFYNEPVDAVKEDSALQRPRAAFEGIKTKIKHRNKIHPRLLNHRHSDPNIQWPLPKNSGALETIFSAEDSQTLSSSLNNLTPQNNGVATDAKGGFVNAGFHSQSSQSLLLDKNSSPIKLNPQSTANKVDNEPSEKLLFTQKLPLMLPKLMSGNRSFNNSSWPVDSSWEWLGIDDDSLLGDSDVDDDATIESLIRKKDAKFPLGEFRRETSLDTTSMQCSDRITVEDLIQQKSPDLHVPEIQPLTRSNLLRVSEYDNLDDSLPVEKDNFAFDRSETASSMTEFSEPWDSSPWDQLLRYVNEVNVIPEETEVEKNENCFNASAEQNEKPKQTHLSLTVSEKANTLNGSSSMSLMVDDGMSLSSLPTVDMDRDSSCATQEKNQISLPSMNVFLLRGKNKNLGDSIREYVIRLSQDKGTTFGNTIDHFIRCTLEGHEMNPHVVMRNVRQFMSGIKNYLVKSGEGQFETVVQSERSKLKANEFLNLDAILESVLNKIVIKPLKKHIYQLFVNEYTRSGALKLLSDNIKYARTKTPEEFGIKPGFNLLKGLAMDAVHHFLRRLQQVYSPMKKLENLLAAIASIIKSIQSEKRKGISLGTDDFLPLLMYVLVHCGMIAAEIEADYMWGLLHPSLLTGEGGYYLTTLSSAVHVLKNFQKCHNEYYDGIFRSFEARDPVLPNMSDMQGSMKILIPDELNGSIISKTFPTRPRMNTREIGKMIAHKFSITNPQDYGLFKLVNGEETLLMDSECPYFIKAELTASGIDCAFAYKRVDAKIAWPLSSKS